MTNNDEPSTSRKSPPAITPEQRRAFDIRDECPFSIHKFVQLFQHLAKQKVLNNNALEATLQFVRENRLPKAKTLDWLTTAGITSDQQLYETVWLPMMERFATCDAARDSGS